MLQGDRINRKIANEMKENRTKDTRLKRSDQSLDAERPQKRTKE
jgi:hypothetical protein